MEANQTRRRLLARNRWALAYTLLKNPILRAARCPDVVGNSRFYVVRAATIDNDADFSEA